MTSVAFVTGPLGMLAACSGDAAPWSFSSVVPASSVGSEGVVVDDVVSSLDFSDCVDGEASSVLLDFDVVEEEPLPPVADSGPQAPRASAEARERERTVARVVLRMIVFLRV
ncbi:hypothetical protein GCM10009763_26000 [Dermacoccus profundi]|uniref:Secreted protein n=2 Tax=Dermacoccus TaxID=57495 RepID=A0ABN2BSE1_9MICO